LKVTFDFSPFWFDGDPLKLDARINDGCSLTLDLFLFGLVSFDQPGFFERILLKPGIIITLGKNPGLRGPRYCGSAQKDKGGRKKKKGKQFPGFFPFKLHYLLKDISNATNLPSVRGFQFRQIIWSS
jgi:hypothetical protein